MIDKKEIKVDDKLLYVITKELKPFDDTYYTIISRRNKVVFTESEAQLIVDAIAQLIKQDF